MLVGAVAGQAAVALRAAAVDGLNQEPVDLLTKLNNVWSQGSLFQTPWRREHILVQWRAAWKELNV